MGLTIHYHLRSRAQSAQRARQLVERMRQLALDLPFEQVHDVRHFTPKECQTPLDKLRDHKDKDLFGAVLDACQYVAVPWGKKKSISVTVQPLEILSFNTEPGPGSEWASFGLARYPETIQVPYSPEDDDRFLVQSNDGAGKGGYVPPRFDYQLWRRWLRSQGHVSYQPVDSFRGERPMPVKLSGWRYSSFCKTQYASNPDCGGVPNFVRCHLCVIHLLDRIGQLPTTTVEIDDEGKYGRSCYTDDWQAEKPVYTWHEGKYDVKALVEEVGQWNGMIAAVFGALKDAVGKREDGTTVAGEITKYPDFERLEFKGQNQEHLVPFLEAMRQAAATGTASPQG